MELVKLRFATNSNIFGFSWNLHSPSMSGSMVGCHAYYIGQIETSGMVSDIWKERGYVIIFERIEITIDTGLSATTAVIGKLNWIFSREPLIYRLLAKENHNEG